MNRSPNIECVNVRSASVEDAASITRIYNHYVDAGGSTFDDQHWTTDRTAERIEAAYPNGWFVAAGDEGTGERGTGERKIWGWASVRPYSMRHGYRFTCESAIYLDPDAIGCGVGDRLQSHVDQHCAQCRIHHAVARIVADNQRSIAFHRRHGYRLVGIQKEIGHINGHWVDVAILQKVF